MHCQQLIHPKMPAALKASIASFAIALHQRRTEFDLVYGNPNPNTTSDQYRQYIKQHGMPRPVGFWRLPDELKRDVERWNQLVGTEPRGVDWQIQFVKGGSSIAPHKDLTSKRTHNIVYVIQTGGNNVATSWWRTKDDSAVPETTTIPFEQLELKESCILQEDGMYELDVSTIHSVSKFDAHRILLSYSVIK